MASFLRNSLLLISLLWTGIAAAQTVPPVVEDVTWPRLSRTGNLYQYAGWVQPGDTITKLLCLERVDTTPPISCGCTEVKVPGEHVYMSFSLAFTPNDDAEVRAFAYDDFNLNTALRSDYSENAAILPMTPPGRPRVE